MAQQREKMSSRQGRTFWDGNEVSQNVKFMAEVEIETSSKRVAGQLGMSHKALGFNVTGSMNMFMDSQNTFLRELMQFYRDNRRFPEVDVQGVLDDDSSDYFTQNGDYRVQLIGVQPTGSLPLIDLDAEGEEQMIEFDFVAEDYRIIP